MKSTLTKGLLNFAVLLIRLLPRAFVPWLASLFSILAPRLLQRDRQLIEDNVARVYRLPGLSSFSRDFQRQVFRSQAVIALETIKNLCSRKKLVTFTGMDEARVEMQRLTRQGKGLVVVTAHIGSWEMVAGAVADLTGRTFVALAKPSKLPEFTAFLDSMRRTKANTEVLWTDSKNLLRDMMKTLKTGGNLGFVMDQKPGGRVGPLVEFLGQPTEFVSGPAKLAAKHQSGIVAIFCMRTGPWTYRIVYETVSEPGSGETDELVLTQKMASALSRAIKLYPEQWIWNYKRWRKQNPMLNQSGPKA